MAIFRRLKGLPPYGPIATGFPHEWSSVGQEGIVVEFTTASGICIGNFRHGAGGLDEVQSHPDKQHVLVFSSGALWCVNPESRTAEEIANSILDIWYIGESGDLLLNDQGLSFESVNSEI
jgi:hypothetical protein